MVSFFAGHILVLRTNQKTFESKCYIYMYVYMYAVHICICLKNMYVCLTDSQLSPSFPSYICEHCVPAANISWQMGWGTVSQRICSLVLSMSQAELFSIPQIHITSHPITNYMDGQGIEINVYQINDTLRIMKDSKSSRGTTCLVTVKYLVGNEETDRHTKGGSPMNATK